MFNLGRILRFLHKFLVDFVLWIVVVCGLAILTAVLTYHGELPEPLFPLAFWFSVGLNMLPAVLVTIIVFWLPGRFLRSVYGLNSWQEGFDFLVRSRFGQFSFSPWMRVSEGKISMNPDSILTRIGGPGNLIIYNDNAVVLEKGGRLTRVAGPGFPKLEPFEKIYDIVDLRPKRWVYTVSAMTKEGIPVSWDAEVHYQIADGGQKPIEKSPYPLSNKDVFRAATCKWRREAGRVQDMDWEGRVVIGDTEGILRSILARRPLDQLIGLTETDERAAREAIQEELQQRLREAVYPKLGAKILQVKLDNFKVDDIDDTVTQQWIEFWKTCWQSRSAKQLAQGEATHIYRHETAKAEAQMRLLVSISRAFQDLDFKAATPSIILMRLFSVLDRACLPASARVFVPGQALEALEKIKQLSGGN